MSLGKSSNNARSYAAGVGIDSTNTNSADIFGMSESGDAGTPNPSFYLGYPGIGYHSIVWLEISDAGGTMTWYGDNAITYNQAGMIGIVMG